MQLFMGWSEKDSENEKFQLQIVKPWAREGAAGGTGGHKRQWVLGHVEAMWLNVILPISLNIVETGTSIVVTAIDNEKVNMVGQF